jgi:hypothetical protein
MTSRKRRMLLPVLLAGLVNAVPSLAQLHPLETARAPIDDDFMGSGCEPAVTMPLPRAARRQGGSSEDGALSTAEIDEARRRLEREMRIAAALAVAAATAAAFLVTLGLL